MYSPDMGDSGCGWWFDGWSRILSDSKGLTIGCTAQDFPSLRDSKPAHGLTRKVAEQVETVSVRFWPFSAGRLLEEAGQAGRKSAAPGNAVGWSGKFNCKVARIYRMDVSPIIAA